MNMIALGAGLCMLGVGLGIGLGQGQLAGKAMESMAKQPEAADKIRTAMIVAMAIMETIGVLAFVIAIIMTGKL